jgi:hypothetical protein
MFYIITANNLDIAKDVDGAQKIARNLSRIDGKAEIFTADAKQTDANGNINIVGLPAFVFRNGTLSFVNFDGELEA